MVWTQWFFYETKQKFSCFLEGLKYTKLFCLLWGGWQFRIVNKFLSNYCCLEQGCRPWGCRAPDFGRSVNPISTRGGRLCPPNNTVTPGFQTFLRPCLVTTKSCQLSNLERKINITWVKLSVLSPFVLISQLYCYFLLFDLKWQSLTQISQYFFFSDFLIGAVLTKLLLSGGNMEVRWSSRNWHVLVWH